MKETLETYLPEGGPLSSAYNLSQQQKRQMHFPFHVSIQ